MSALRKTFSVILLLLTLLTVGFIFYNSALPPEKSQEQSSTVGDIIAEIIPPETEAGGFVQKYLRKIAHFTEYGLLGIELMLLCAVFAKRKLRFGILSLGAAVLVALIDETVQIFSARGPAVQDIWIDVGGFVFFALITVALLSVIHLFTVIVNRIKYAP